MPTSEEQPKAEPGLIEEPDLQAKVDSVEKLLNLLLSDEAIGNVLKGPLRLSSAASMFNYAADGEASDTYAITVAQGPTSYVAGQEFTFKANTANTGAATLNVNGLGAKAIKKRHDQDLANNDIEAGQLVTVRYDGTNFQMQSQLANAVLGGADSSAIHDDEANEITAIANKTPVAADEFIIEDSEAGYVKKAILFSALEAILDHGNLAGLSDIADHAYALLKDGTRDLTGDLSVDAGITIDGVDVGAHGASYNGSFVEPLTFVVTSNGSTITGTIDKNPSGDLTERFSDGYSTLSSGGTVSLIAGSATAPKKNYVYVLQSNKGVLVASDSDWPAAEHIAVAEVIVQTAALVQSDGILANRNWNDFAQGTDGMGHHLHSWERLRWEHSAYKSGSAVTWSGSGGATLDLAITAGKIYQMHLQDTSAFDTTDPDKVYVVNHPTPYTATADIETITVDSDNDPLSNKYYNLVIWHSVSSGSEEEKVFINLPSGSYTKQGDATSDVSGYDNYSIPSGFRGYGFLIQRVTIKHSTGGGGTWTIIQETDLRGSVPTVAVGSGTASITTEFADNQFRLFDEGDPTSEIAFQASGISGSTTRTVTVPDKDLTLIDSADAIAAVEGEATLALSGAVEITGILTVDVINEKTGAAGVTIDSVLLKDKEVWLPDTDASPVGDIRLQNFDENLLVRNAADSAYVDVIALSIIGITSLVANQIDERTGGSGVTVDSVLLKDGLVDGVDVAARDHAKYTDADALAAAKAGAGIADDDLMQVDDADAADNDYAKFTAAGLEGRSFAEMRGDINVADGADVTGDNAPQAHAAGDHSAANIIPDANQAYTGDMAITGALTATSYGGITEANLLDKTATETVSGAYTHTHNLIMDGADLFMGNNRVKLNLMDMWMSTSGSTWATVAFRPNAGNRDAVFVTSPSGSASGAVFEVYDNSSLGVGNRHIFKNAGGTLKIGGDGAGKPIEFIFNNVAKVLMDTSGNVRLVGNLELDADLNHDGSNVGFYGTAPVAQQTGVAVTDAAIHAALVSLGLITA